MANFSSAKDGRTPNRREMSPRLQAVPDDGRPQAVARYLADMTGQLESMARAAKLDLLAYLLAMARAEAETANHDLSNAERAD